MRPTGPTGSRTSAWSVADGELAGATHDANPASEASTAPGASTPPRADATPTTALAPGAFDRDTAVRELSRSTDAEIVRAEFAADVSADWRAGRGPHGGYLAAMLLRALVETIADPARSP